MVDRRYYCSGGRYLLTIVIRILVYIYIYAYGLGIVLEERIQAQTFYGLKKCLKYYLVVSSRDKGTLI